MSVEPTKGDVATPHKESFEIETQKPADNEIAFADKNVIPHGEVSVDVQAPESFITLKQVRAESFFITTSSVFQSSKVSPERVGCALRMQSTTFLLVLALIP